MTTSRGRGHQRGNSMLLAMIVLSALGALGSLTVVSVQGVLKASTNDRSQAIALYAAESGAAVAIEALRRNYVYVDHSLPPPQPAPPALQQWSAFVHTSNTPDPTPLSTAVMPSNEAQPGTPQNLFTPELNAWYSVTVLNNPDDPAFKDADNCDSDGQVIIQATGHGPQGALAVMQWEIRRLPPQPQAPPDPANPPPPGRVPYPPDPADPSKRGVILLGWRVVF